MLQERKCSKCGTTSTPQWRNRGPNMMCNACGIKDQAERRKAAKRSAEEHAATPVKSARTGQGGSHHPSRAQAPSCSLPSILAALLPFGHMLTPARAGVRGDPAAPSSPPAAVHPAPSTIDLSLGVPFDFFDLPLDLVEPQIPQQPNVNGPPTSSRGSLMRQMHQPADAPAGAGQVSLLDAAPHMMAETGQPPEVPGTQAPATDKEATSSLRVEQPAQGSKFAMAPVDRSGEIGKEKDPQAGPGPKAMPDWPSVQSFMPWDISTPGDPSSHLAGTTGAQSLRLEHGGRSVVEPASGRVVKTLAALPDVQLLHQSCAGSSGVVMEHVCPGLTLTLQLVMPDRHAAAGAGSSQVGAKAARVLARVSVSHERSGVVVAYLDDVQSGRGRRVPHLVRGCPAWESGEGWVVLFSDPSQLEGFMGAIARAPGHIQRCETHG